MPGMRPPFRTLVLCAWAASGLAQDRAGVDFFEARIRPVLAQKCYACHSSKTVATSNLRLDSRSGMLTGGTRGAAIVAGDSSRSLLYRAVSYTDSTLSMPPSGKLADEQIADFKTWIEMGAPDPRVDEPKPGRAAPTIDFERGRKHWAFQPVRIPELPATRNKAWITSPVDAFILAGLEEKGLRPAAPADRRTLLRRVTFDLIGLPPTPEEIAAFLADRSPRAFEKVVDRLLASPHYGERWGRHWLDLARFAETSGHEFDSEKPDAWRYRDYVIRAFNDDLPYDQFIREQIAGDVLPRPRLAADAARIESPVGSGFFALHEERNAADDLGEVQSEKVDNQIDVLAKTFLGLTVACARCHDHKFDPIPTADYYALAGVMNSTRQMEIEIDSPDRRREIDSIQSKVAAVNGRITMLLSSARQAAVRSVSRSLVAPTGSWKTYLEQAAKDPSHVFYPWAILSAEGDKPFGDRLKAVRSDLERFAEESAARGDIVFADFRHGNYDGWEINGPAFGTAPAGTLPPNLAVSGFRGGLASSFGAGSNALTGILTSRSFKVDKRYLHVRMAGTQDKTRRREHGVLRFTLQIAGRPAFINTDKEGVFEWKTAGLERQKGLNAYLVIADRATDGYIAVEKIVFSDRREPPQLDSPPNARVLDALSGADSVESLAAAYERAFLDAAAKPVPDRDDVWLLSALPGSLEDQAANLRESERAELAALQKERAEIVATLPASQYSVVSRDDAATNCRIAIRGNLDNPGPEVPRRYLELLDPSKKPFGTGSGRGELAEAIASAQSPLTSRVMVNRIWKQHFGNGIVRSMDNFGATGDRPTHPALLDFLASRFISSGWSVKSMHRMIVLSSTYRMASRADNRAASIDPDNKLLRHMPVRRLEAEAIRDAILTVTGTLDRTVYGPPVPPHISAYQDGRGKPPSGPLDGRGRRSVYIQLRRNFLPPFLLAFDFPVPATTVGRRTTTTVPAQALMLMNNEFVASQAEKWAARITASTADVTARIELMYLEAFGRSPERVEIARVVEYLKEQGEASAWKDLAHVLFNSKEFIFVR